MGKRGLRLNGVTNLDMTEAVEIMTAPVTKVSASEVQLALDR